jgi:hypothetical protein
MARYTFNSSKDEINGDVSEFTAGEGERERERETVFHCINHQSLSGVTKKCSEKNVAEFNDFKTFFVEISEVMKEKLNKALRDSLTSIKEEIKTEIERSLKRSELEAQRLNRELLDYIQKLVNVLNKSSTEGNRSQTE